MIFLDLYLTLYNPFYPREKRMWKYCTSLILLTIIVVSYLVYEIS